MIFAAIILTLLLGFWLGWVMAGSWSYDRGYLDGVEQGRALKQWESHEREP